MFEKQEWFAVIVVAILVIVLTGCASTTVPVTMNFPQAPEPLLLEPEKLDPLPEDAKEMTELLENSTVNYGKHRELQIKYLRCNVGMRLTEDYIKKQPKETSE